MNKSARRDRCVFCTASKTWQIGLRTLVWKRTSNSYNIFCFWICLRLINKNILKAWLKLCTEIPESQKLGWRFYLSTRIKISIESELLVYYVKECSKNYVKETHMLLVTFWWTFVKIVVVSQYKRQRNKSFSRFVHNLKTPLGLKSALAALCKWTTLTRQTCLSKTIANSPNEQKQ